MSTLPEFNKGRQSGRKGEHSLRFKTRALTPVFIMHSFRYPPEGAALEEVWPSFIDKGKEIAHWKINQTYGPNHPPMVLNTLL